MQTQQGWRWCRKCQGLFYEDGASLCPGRGAHDGTGSSHFALPTGDDAIGQRGWLWCKKCQGLFFGDGESSCPAGEGHDGSESAPHALPLDALGGAAQSGWRWCRKCQGLFYGDGTSFCPAGDSHDGSLSSEHFLPLEGRTFVTPPIPHVAPLPPAPPQRRPVSKDLAWIVWYDRTDAERNKHDIAIAGVVRNLDAALGRMSTAKIWVYETNDSASAFAHPPPVVDFFAFDQHPDRSRILGLVLLGSFPWWEDYTPEENAQLMGIKAVLLSTEIPILAFCGGHQLVAKAFATDGPEPVGHIFESDNQRDRKEPSSAELNYNQEFGKACTVELTEAGQEDPIFHYLGGSGRRRNPRFMFWHHDEIKHLHPDFTLLGSTDLCRNQALKHNDRLIYTTQFHPEQSGGSLDGDGFVQTFFEMAARYWLDRGVD